MGHSTRLIAWICLCAALAAGCGIRPFSYVTLWMRDPGLRNKDLPDRVADQYECGQKRLPFFAFEKHQLIPNRVSPGANVNHRLVYVLCPAAPTGVVVGTLRTRIFFEGEVIVSQDIEEKLRPGRWVIDSTIMLPSNAAAGVYAMDVRFESRKGNLESQTPFLVK